MGERGQKILKWIVWTIIITFVVFEVVRFVISLDILESDVSGQVGSTNSETLTRVEWMTGLAEEFGDATILHSIQDGEQNTTGEYAALTVMNVIGDTRLEYLIDDMLTDTSKISFAIESGIMNQEMFDKEITKKDAEEIVFNALDWYCNPQYYPEYFEFESKVDVIIMDKSDIQDYDKDTQMMTLTMEGDIPNTGTMVMFTNEYGIAQVKYVDQIEPNSTGEYLVQVRDIEDVSEVFDTLSFSGTSDFSYLAEQEKGSEATASSMETFISSLGNSLALTVHAVEIKKMLSGIEEWVEEQHSSQTDYSTDTKMCDIEFSVEITDSQGNGKEDVTITSYISVTSDGSAEIYKYTVDNKEESLLLVDEWSDFGMVENENGFHDISYTKEEMGAIANVKFENFGVCTSGYYQVNAPNDENNYVEVLLSADKINIDLSGKLSSQVEYRIGTIPIPIQSTAGIISVTLHVNLVVDANGEATIWCAMDHPHFGISASVTGGAKPLYGWSDRDAGVNARIDVGGGFISEVVVVALDTITLANPVVDARVVASSSVFEMPDIYRLKDGYEEINCIELNVQAPIVTMEASTDETSILYKLLETTGAETFYDLVQKDSDSELLKKISYHVEHEEERIIAIGVEEGQKQDDVCTHIEKKSIEELEMEGIAVEELVFDEEVEEADEKLEDVVGSAKGKFNQMIEDMVQNWVAENCLQCFE